MLAMHLFSFLDVSYNKLQMLIDREICDPHVLSRANLRRASNNHKVVVSLAI